MSLTNVNQNRELSTSSQVQPVRDSQKKMLIAGITVLVISIIGVLIGMSLLSYGIALSLPNVVILGTILVGFSVLGILIASLLIGLSRQQKILLLEQDKRSLLESWQRYSQLESEISARQETRIQELLGTVTRGSETNKSLCKQLIGLHEETMKMAQLWEEKIALWEEKEKSLTKDIYAEIEENKSLLTKIQILKESIETQESKENMDQQILEQYRSRIQELEEKIKILEQKCLELQTEEKK